MDHEIVQDLLPLYRDGVCSEKSRAAVEEHLKTCRDCQTALAALDAPLPEAARRQAADDASVVAGLSREWKRGKWRARLRGVLLGALACVLLAFGYWALFQWYSRPVPADVLEVTDLARLSDGRVVFHLYVNDRYDLNRVDETQEGSVQYIIPLRPLVCRERSTDGGLWDWNYAVDVAADSEWPAGREPVTAVYLGRGEDAVLVWEEGMDPPPANAAQEAQYGLTPGGAESQAAQSTP